MHRLSQRTREVTRPLYTTSSLLYLASAEVGSPGTARIGGCRVPPL